MLPKQQPGTKFSNAGAYGGHFSFTSPQPPIVLPGSLPWGPWVDRKHYSPPEAASLESRLSWSLAQAGLFRPATSTSHIQPQTLCISLFARPLPDSCIPWQEGLLPGPGNDPGLLSGHWTSCCCCLKPPDLLFSSWRSDLFKNSVSESSLCPGLLSQILTGTLLADCL